MNKNFLLVLLLFCIFHPERNFAQCSTSKTSIFFETDQSELSAEARQILDALAPALLQAPDYQVNIEAFTDDRGTPQYNLRLAADRAASVQTYLAAKGLIADKTAVVLNSWWPKKKKRLFTLFVTRSMPCCPCTETMMANRFPSCGIKLRDGFFVLNLFANGQSNAAVINF